VKKGEFAGRGGRERDATLFKHELNRARPTCVDEDSFPCLEVTDEVEELAGRKPGFGDGGCEMEG